MQFSLSTYFKFLLVYFLFSACGPKEKENTNNHNNLKILANQIMSEGDPKKYRNRKNKFINTPNDSIKNSLIFDISYHFYIEDDSLKFREWNKYSYSISKVRKNESGTAEAYWDLGNFFYKKNIIDSSYYHYNLAYEKYLEVNEDLKSGRMLLNMAILQEKVKDYVGSENTLEKSCFHFLHNLLLFPVEWPYSATSCRILGLH